MRKSTDDEPGIWRQAGLAACALRDLAASMSDPSERAPSILLVLSYVVVFVSLVGQVAVGLSLFSRSGALMVALSIQAEFSLLRGRDLHHSDQLRRLAEGAPEAPGSIHPSDRHQTLEWLAHLTTILGTLIWGYGDLVLG